MQGDSLPPGGTTGRRLGPSRAEPSLQDRGWETCICGPHPCQDRTPSHPLKTLEAHCVVHISELPVGQWAMCTQNPGRKGQVRGLTETCSKALSSFYQKPCWVLSRDR
ncbi:Hypothetical predicted protein [Marmota monax]|uniref:Arginine-glutamic acid dipeptide repeats protein n=1 Tax=Marmota monax TaxID=9995 RepID=A0A5E4AJZ6_MARMO|nr:arginine-glutamic acid dipeptide repeats protein [Marmota monax]VTJ57545.1 Hypothetical predicted protein [Marmota monax]